MRVSAHFQKIAKRSLVGLAFLIVLSGLVALGTQVFAADPVRWTGAVSQDWDDAGNWEGRSEERRVGKECPV